MFNMRSMLVTRPLLPGLMGLLKRAVGIGRRRQTLANSTLVHYHSRLQKRLDTLLAITPMTAAGQKLQRIIKRFRPNLFVFITNRAVPPNHQCLGTALPPLRGVPQGNKFL